MGFGLFVSNLRRFMTPTNLHFSMAQIWKSHAWSRPLKLVSDLKLIAQHMRWEKCFLSCTPSNLLVVSDFKP